MTTPNQTQTEQLAADGENISLRWAADNFAYYAHQGQTRRDGKTSYYFHCERVAKRLGTNVLKAIGYLHDVLEDTDKTIADMKAAGITDEVIAAVVAMTHEEHEPYMDYYLARVKANPLARQVKIADMIENLSDSPTEKQIIKYAKGLLFLHDSL